MAESGTQNGPGGLAAKVRAHKALTAILAVAGFLGLGSILGQWSVDRIIDAFRGDTPPAGFKDMHAAWRSTARLNDRLVAFTITVNDDLGEGANSAEEDPELDAGLRSLHRLTTVVSRAEFADIRLEANKLVGHIRAIDTDLAGPRGDMARLAALIGATTQRIEDGIDDAYATYQGQPIARSVEDPISGQPRSVTPIFSDELQADALEQHDLVTQVASGLGRPARRFDHPVPTIRGWNRLLYPDASSDSPL